MAIARIQPVQELRSLQETMTDMFEDLLSRARGGDSADVSNGSWTPPVDLFETSDRIVFRADLPGVSPHDLEIRIEGGQLTVRGERRLDSGMRREDYLRIERPFGAFSRSFALPPDADPAAARAELRNGLLEISIARRRERPAASVEIRLA
jgi:HSP20 family protein